MLAALALWTNLTRNGSVEWTITILSLSTLPNTLVMGILLLIAMYPPEPGIDAGSLIVQFPETAASIVSFKVDSNVVSLDGRDFLEIDVEIGEDGKLHVTVRKSNASRRLLGPGSLPALTPRPSNLTGAEIYSLSSSRNPSPLHNRASLNAASTSTSNPSSSGSVSDTSQLPPGSACNARPGHRRSASAEAPLIYSGSSCSATSAYSPSGKILKTMASRTSNKSDTLGHRTGNYWHGSIVRAGNAAAAKVATSDPEELKRAANEILPLLARRRSTASRSVRLGRTHRSPISSTSLLSRS